MTQEGITICPKCYGTGMLAGMVTCDYEGCVNGRLDSCIGDAGDRFGQQHEPTQIQPTNLCPDHNLPLIIRGDGTLHCPECGSKEPTEIQSALSWYGERAHELANLQRSDDYHEAVIAELLIDGGKRAREALSKGREK